MNYWWLGLALRVFASLRETNLSQVVFTPRRAVAKEKPQSKAQSTTACVKRKKTATPACRCRGDQIEFPPVGGL